MESLTVFAPMLGILGLVIAGLIYAYIRNQSPGNELMVEISEAIHEGAMIFLRREYSYLVFFITAVFIGLALFINTWTAAGPASQRRGRPRRLSPSLATATPRGLRHRRRRG